MDGKFVAIPADVDPIPVPEIGGTRHVEQTPAFWWMVGRWLGSGWTRSAPDDAEATSGHSAARTEPATCPGCGSPARAYPGSTPGQVYCSPECARMVSQAPRGTAHQDTHIC